MTVLPVNSHEFFYHLLRKPLMKFPDKPHKQDVAKKGIDVQPVAAMYKPSHRFRKLFGRRGNDARQQDRNPSLPSAHMLQEHEAEYRDERQDKQRKADMNLKQLGKGACRKGIQLLFDANEVHVCTQPRCEDHRRQVGRASSACGLWFAP